jgi:hypothetical protein
MRFTLENIRTIIEETEYQTEFFTYKFDRWGDDSFNMESQFGIKLSQDVWFWFKNMPSFNNKLEPSGEYYFSHRYSQKTGATIRSWRQGMKATQRIESILKNL